MQDTRQNAEAAKAALDFMPMQQKPLRVRFATHGAALRVKNFSQWVTNELLELAFSVFGEVERAVVIVDDRGRSVGEGIVEFSRKQAAQQALKRCSEECFILTRSVAFKRILNYSHRTSQMHSSGCSDKRHKHLFCPRSGAL